MTTEYSISNAIELHDELNPELFKNNSMLPDIRKSLLRIAYHFKEFIGIPLDVVDVTISGSNAAFSYTPESDIDLHIVVNIPDDPKYLELLHAKKNEYNTKYNITIKGIDVELYAQPIFEEHHSVGIFSLLKNTWVSIPVKDIPAIDGDDVKHKYKNYRDRIKLVLNSDNYKIAKHTADSIKKMRQAGLGDYGEFSTENLVFKMLRAQGWIDKLYEHIDNIVNQTLSLEGIEMRANEIIKEFSPISPVAGMPAPAQIGQQPATSQQFNPKVQSAMAAQLQQDKTKQKKAIQDQIAALTKQIAELRKQLAMPS